jgi:hypothetical protein
MAALLHGRLAYRQSRRTFTEIIMLPCFQQLSVVPAQTPRAPSYAKKLKAKMPAGEPFTLRSAFKALFPDAPNAHYFIVEAQLKRVLDDCVVAKFFNAGRTFRGEATWVFPIAAPKRKGRAPKRLSRLEQRTLREQQELRCA